MADGQRIVRAVLATCTVVALVWMAADLSINSISPESLVRSTCSRWDVSLAG
jgi:hypothetical protein